MKTFSVLLALAAGISSVVAQDVQGQDAGAQLEVGPEEAGMEPDSFGTMIVGGTPVPNTDSALRFTVSLQSKSGTKFYHFCGGSLIHPRWVLTAAHCVKYGSPYRIQVGTYDISSSRNGQVIIVNDDSAVSIHPLYGSLRNDIALIRLPTEVKGVTPVALNPVPLSSAFESVGTMLSVVGWGYAVEGSGVTETNMRTVDVPQVSTQKCKVPYPAVTVDQVCAGYDFQGKDSCQGDSGGPLFHRSDSNEITLIGAVSYGRGCARAGFYGVYTRISRYFDWVESILHSNGDALDYKMTTGAPTSNPAPTARPTRGPTSRPTRRPTKAPTSRPTKRPTKSPTSRPTKSPVTSRPTKSPTPRPTKSG